MNTQSEDPVETDGFVNEAITSPVSDVAVFDDEDIDLPMPPIADEDDQGNEDDSDRIYAPPPRIAARFYRPSQTRRKDSAASSRRNSISSAHSRCSSTQTYGRHSGGPQSKQVAQHLRRKSFLEDRKARLADRAAHAEKVRLRAAMAKAVPRATSTSSEERALAAQLAREKKLAEIVANCAEDVKKAKAVAETMKEKREMEMARVRAKMEERMAEADRRREEMRTRLAPKRVRGQSMNNNKAADASAEIKEKEAPTYSPEVAAGKIQWWWRTALRKRAVADFSELGLTVDGTRETDFDHVVALLNQEKVLTETARVLNMCGLKEGDTGSVSEMAAVRTFLSAFLILGHPNQVLSNKDGTGEQEQDLVAKARDLLVSFENIFSRLTSYNNYTAPPGLRHALPEVYATFHNAFIGWKSRDSDALIQVMLMQFVELDLIWQTVKDSADDASAEPYRESIKDNQVKLIVRIKKLAGQERGKKMIADAVKEARKARAAKKPQGDLKPRVTDSGEQATDAAQSLVSAGQEPSQAPTPPVTPSKPSVAPQPIILGPGLSGLLPENRIVVHELAINKEYRIPAQEYRQHRAKAQEHLFRGMRAAIDADDASASFTYFAVMIRYFKDSLQRLVRSGAYMHKTIGEILDVELAEEQFKIGSFSYEKFFSSISSLLPKLCAPLRDAEVKDLVENKLQSGDLIGRVEALTAFIDVMLCDYVNYMLSSVAPGLIESAPQYEAKKFVEVMADDDGYLSLPAAGAAWRTARAKVMSETSKRDQDGINHPKSRPTAEKFYAQMLVDLFTQPLPIKKEAIPEMLLLDVKRMARLSMTSQRIVTAAAILLQCKNMLKRDVRSPWKTEATRIMTVLEAQHENVDTAAQGVMAALEGGRSMPAATKTHLRAMVTKMLHASRDAISGGSEPREPVLRLLLTRLRGHMFARLGAGSASEKVKAASTAGEKLANLGLAEFAPQVREMLEEVSRVGAADRAAHTRWWEVVDGSVQAEDDQEGSESAQAEFKYSTRRPTASS